MARIRSIKPGFFTDDFIAELEPIERLFFIGLFTQADRSGRLEDRPRRLKAQIIPFDDADVDAILDKLNSHQERFIIRYEIDGKRYIWIRTFERHQKPHHQEPDSVIPKLINLETSVIKPKSVGDSPLQSRYKGGFSFSRSLSCKQPLVQPSAKAAPKESLKNFFEWWKAYPNKTGKAAAKKKWDSLVRGKIDFKKMMDTLKKQKTSEKWTKEGGRYIPNPATYLNQGRWDDEVKSGIVGGTDIIGSRPGEDLKEKYRRLVK